MYTGLFKDEIVIQQLLDVLPVAVFVKDADSRFQLMNKACEAQWGMRFMDLEGTDASQFFPSDQMARFLARDKEVFAGGCQIDFEETFWNAALGQNRTGHTFKKPVFDASGKPLYLICVTIDITGQKQAESDLRVAAVAFESQESMMITDANKVILCVNQAFVDETGYTAEEVIGQTPRLLTSGTQDQAFYHQMWDAINRTGKWQGEIWDRRKSGEIYPKWLTISAVKGPDRVVTHYIGSHVDITARKAAEEQLRYLTCHDPLTDLPNREGLHERMSHLLGIAKRNKKKLSLMLIDLDNFKDINDTMGHLVGDQVLVEVAQRLVKAVRQSDIVSRIGGDEFVIMLPDVESSEDAAHVAKMILKTVSEPYLINGEKLYTTPSIGICLYPDDAVLGEDMIKKADVAMYHAKAAGRRNYQFFTEKLQQAALHKSAMEKDLRVALEQQQFMLYYQPQLDLRTGKLVGVEALVRWQHPVRGIVSPFEFIPIAEETGQIIALGDWVLEEACRQLAEWRAGGIRHIKMSVNLAAKQFSDKNLPARIQEVMTQYALPANSLDLEVTESMTMGSPVEAIKMMKVLTSYGQSLSIDDFGTGYSSLAYLKLFPVSTLKIDRAFVKDIEHDPEDASICDITALLAHKLGMDVVAEGVETEAQLKFLHSISCEKIQGYLISKPLPADQAEYFIRNQPDMTSLGTIDLWGIGSQT